MEEVRAGGDQAHGGGETGQGDDGGQDELTRLPKQAQHVGVDDGAAVADVGGDAGCGVAQLEQGDVDHGQSDGGDDARDGQVLELALVVMNAFLTQQVDDQGTEHQGRQGVHGVVAFQDPFHEGAFLIVTGRGRHVTLRGDEHADGEGQQQQHQHRGQVFADGIHQLALIHGNQDGHAEEQHSVGCQTGLTHVTDERLEAHFVSYQPGTGGGEGWTDDDVDGDGQCGGHAGRQQLGHAGPAIACLGDGDDGDERQTDGSDQETQHGEREVLTCHVTGQRREDDVAGAQIEGEGHEAQSEHVGQCE